MKIFSRTIFINLLFLFFMVDNSFAENISPTDLPGFDTISTTVPVNQEFRGIVVFAKDWVSKNPDECKQNIVTILKNISETNFNCVIFQVRTESETLYPSQYEPWSYLIGNTSPGFDPLELAISEAHKNGLKFFAYVDLTTLYNKKTLPIKTSPEHLFFSHGLNTKQPWICVDETGKPDDSNLEYYFLSLGIPEVQIYLRKIVLDLVKRYDIDGLTFDNVAYPGPQYSYDNISKERFYGRGNLLRNEWFDWQREQINKFVTDVYAEIISEKPEIIVSYSVYGIYKQYFSKDYYNFVSGFYEFYQDSLQWTKLGAADFVIPKIFYDISNPKPNFDDLTKNFCKVFGARYIIPGHTVFDNDTDLKELAKQINFAKTQNFSGSVIYSYSTLKNISGLQKLKETIFIEKKLFPKIIKSNNGIILGTVTDENGFPLKDAWVTLKSTDSKNLKEIVVQSFPTSADGRFAFLNLSTDPVKLVIEYAGADKKILENIIVQKNEIKKLQITIDGGSSAREKVFYYIFQPGENVTLNKSIHLLGRTLPTNKIKIQDKEVKVFSSGAFAYDNLQLSDGENKILITATDITGKTTTGFFIITKKSTEAMPVEDTPKKQPIIEILEPAKDVMLMTGDVLEIKVKGEPGQKCFATFLNRKLKLHLTEIEHSDGIKTGIYFTRYKVPENFSSPPMPFLITMEAKIDGGYLSFFRSKSKYEQVSETKVEFRDSVYPIIGETIKDNSPIVFGLHSVRLKGPNLAEVPKGTRVEIIGKKGSQFKIKLSKSLSGWISQDDIKILPEGTSVPHNYFTYCTITGTDKYDILRIPMKENVVFAITPETEPQNHLVIDFFNSHYATTWFKYQSSAKIIGIVSGEQIEDTWYRLTVPLKCKHIWGYWAEMGKTGLTIYIKRPPKIEKKNPLEGLTFGIEAGHGGDNIGATGPVGTKEKTINFQLVQLIKNLLEKKGAKTVEMRPGDSSPDFDTRLQYAYDGNADLIISIHANAGSTAGGYLKTGGTSTYYKYKHCQPIADFVFQELIAIGWQEYGIVGNFNYTPLRQTRIPAVLVEQGFLTNPSDEAKILDPQFRKLQAKAIIKGIEKFLCSVNEN